MGLGLAGSGFMVLGHWDWEVSGFGVGDCRVFLELGSSGAAFSAAGRAPLLDIFERPRSRTCILKCPAWAPLKPLVILSGVCKGTKGRYKDHYKGYDKRLQQWATIRRLLHVT